MSYFDNINANNVLHALNPNNMLHAVGLRREVESRMLVDTVLPAFAVFSAGILVGASIALLVTPKTGRELRDDLSRKAGELGETVRGKIPALRSDEQQASTTSTTYGTRSNPNPNI